jgi:signal peptidase I
MDPHTSPPPLRMLAASGGRARRSRATVSIASSILLGCSVLLVIATFAAMALGLVRFRVIDTGSMRPTLNPGDVVVLTSERPSTLADGQIVAFHPPGEPHLTVVHRVRSLALTPSGIVMRTKGDANNVSDPWRARITGATVWRASFTVPFAGYLVVWSQQPAIRMAVLGVMLALVVSILLSRIWRPAAGGRARRHGVPVRTGGPQQA